MSVKEFSITSPRAWLTTTNQKSCFPFLPSGIFEVSDWNIVPRTLALRYRTVRNQHPCEPFDDASPRIADALLVVNTILANDVSARHEFLRVSVNRVALWAACFLGTLKWALRETCQQNTFVLRFRRLWPSLQAVHRMGLYLAPCRMNLSCQKRTDLHVGRLNFCHDSAFRCSL